MDRMMGVATGIAVVAMGKQHDNAKRTGQFGNALIAEGGQAKPLGEQWNTGAEKIKEGRALAGWFVGRAQNKRAEAMIIEGIEMQQAAERDYERLQEVSTGEKQ